MGTASSVSPLPPGMTRPARVGPAVRAAAWLAVLSSAAYFVSDVIEAAQGGFTTGQLWLTLVAEAALPVVAIGLYAVQRPAMGRLGFCGAVGYAAAYVYFTGTVAYALVEGTPDFEALGRALDPGMTIAGAVMVVSGAAFGVATFRAQALPRWTGVALGAGVVLVAVAGAGPVAAELAAVAVRDLAFVGMGVAVLMQGRRERTA